MYRSHLILLLFLFSCCKLFSQIKEQEEPKPIEIPVAENNQILIKQPADRNYILKFIGTYELTPEYRFRLFTFGKDLYFQRIGEEQKFLIYPVFVSQFRLSTLDINLEFRKDKTGSYSEIVFHPDESHLVYPSENRNQLLKILLNPSSYSNMIAKKISSQARELYDEILDVENHFIKVFNDNDSKGFQNIWMRNIELYKNLDKKRNYRQSIRFFKTDYFSAKMKITLVPDSVEVFPISDDTSLETGKYEVVNNENKSIRNINFTHFWKKENGNWKIQRIINSEY